MWWPLANCGGSHAAPAPAARVPPCSSTRSARPFCCPPHRALPKRKVRVDDIATDCIVLHGVRYMYTGKYGRLDAPPRSASGYYFFPRNLYVLVSDRVPMATCQLPESPPLAARLPRSSAERRRRRTLVNKQPTSQFASNPRQSTTHLHQLQTALPPP